MTSPAPPSRVSTASLVRVSAAKHGLCSVDLDPNPHGAETIIASCGMAGLLDSRSP